MLGMFFGCLADGGTGQYQHHGTAAQDHTFAVFHTIVALLYCVSGTLLIGTRSLMTK
jgi:hypothetical protein